jgi:hypothetical protein
MFDILVFSVLIIPIVVFCVSNFHKITLQIYKVFVLRQKKEEENLKKWLSNGTTNHLRTIKG